MKSESYLSSFPFALFYLNPIIMAKSFSFLMLRIAIGLSLVISLAYCRLEYVKDRERRKQEYNSILLKCCSGNNSDIYVQVAKACSDKIEKRYSFFHDFKAYCLKYAFRNETFNKPIFCYPTHRHAASVSFALNVIKLFSNHC